MEKIQAFKFSTEELKKINVLLPKGYKFVTRDELNKKETQKSIPKRKAPQPLPSAMSESVTPPIPKMKIEKEDEYQPQKKVVIVPPVVIPIEEFPAGTSQKLLERIKKHPAYTHLIQFIKINNSDISLRDIEDRVNNEGDLYRITEHLESDFRNFFLTVYQHSVKTSSDYRQAAELDNHILNLLKVERGGDVKRVDSRGTQGGRKRLPQVKIYQPLASYKVASALQKRQLGMMIRKLSSQNLQQVIYIMCQSTEAKECIFDLDNIHIKKFRQLQEYVKKCMEKNAEWDPRTLEDQEFSNESEFIIDNDDS